MATIKTPAAGVSPYQGSAAEPTVLTTTINGRTASVLSASAAATVAAAATAATATAATASDTSVTINGQEALNRVITTSRTGVFEGANVTINLEEQLFNTTNQVTSTTNYAEGANGSIQYNNGSNGFSGDPYFTYTSGNVVTPGIRTDGYFYSNGAPFTSGGNAAIGNFVFTGDNMTIAHANSTLSVTGNGTGNVNISANSKTWTFSNNGNITFPDNSGSSWPINQQRFGMGNIGAWLDGQWTIGEFSGNGVSGQVGIRIDPGIEGNTGITIPSQADSTTQPVQIYNTGGGGISLYTGANNWAFNNDGTTQFPANIILAPEGSPLVLKTTSGNTYSTLDMSGADGYAQTGLQDQTTGAFPAWAFLETDMANVNTPSAVVILKPGDTGTEVRWTFNSDGNTVFPTLSTQRGDVPSGTITGQTLLFGDYASEAVISTPDGVLPYWSSSQRLVINPGAGAANTSGEGGDIYLWAGRGGNASGSGGDIKIRGGQGGASDAGGQGGAGGYVLIEAGDAGFYDAGTGASAGYIQVTGGNGGENQVGGYVRITGGQGSDGNYPGLQGGGDANIQGGYGRVNAPGGNVNLVGGISANGLADYGRVNITSGASTWVFDNAGNLTLPANTFAVNYANGNPVVISGGAAGLPLANGTSNINIATANGNVTITANGSPTWTFGTDGNLTTPGSSGDITGANLIGTISLSAAGNVFGNYLGANIDINAFGNVLANSALMDYLVSSANLQVSGTANVGALSTVGSVSANGNITTLSAMYSGNGATWQSQVSLANVLFVGADVADAYVQAAMIETSGNGSADWVSYSNNGNTDSGWIDMGITGNTFSDPEYELTDPNDGYILVQGTNNLSVPLGGNLVLATGNIGLAHDIVFATGGFTHANIKARLYNSTGEFSVVGNISSNGIVKTGVFVASTIPTASSVSAGSRAFVTDADSLTFGNLYVGSAANAMPVWTDGTNWYIG